MKKTFLALFATIAMVACSTEGTTEGNNTDSTAVSAVDSTTVVVDSANCCTDSVAVSTK